MVASGVTIRSYRSTSTIAEELSLRAWMVVATPLRPWCGGAEQEDSGMFPEVWDSLGFLPNRYLLNVGADSGGVVFGVALVMFWWCW